MSRGLSRFPHSTDVVRVRSGRIAARYSHGKGPCLLDTMTAALQGYRLARRRYLRLGEEVKEKRREARAARDDARHHLAVAVQAGLDAGLSYRAMSEKFGMASSTLHLAHAEDPNAAEPQRQP